MTVGRDETIADDDGLFRRVHPSQMVLDKNHGGWRASSGAFKDAELSVDAEPLLICEGLDWRFTLRNCPGHGVARFTASLAREQAQEVRHDWLHDNHAHALVLGRKPRPVSQLLSRGSELIVHEGQPYRRPIS